jgi:ATP-dependent exoDNAse (exonuclease V) alpha subunit
MAQGKFFEFHKPDVFHTEIMTPASGWVPDWITDRQSLWNAVERAEKRADAQLAREIEITLPRELGREQQVDLVRSFVREHFTSHGMVADVALHEPEAADGERQPHAHVLLTLRRLDGTTATGFDRLKERDWNEREDIAREVAEARKQFNNTSAPDDKAALEAAEARRNVNIWRAAWADHANRALAAIGSQARIDHRTLEAQGIAREAQPYLGVARHIERAYSYIKERVTQWVAVKKRSALYEELDQYRQRDPAQVTGFMVRLMDMAESFAAQFRGGEKPIPEVELER